MSATLQIALAMIGMQAEDDATGRVVPVTEEVAVREFERVCLATFPHLDALKSAIATSDWEYRERPAAMGGLRSNWRSTRGELNYIQPIPRPGAENMPLPQCNMTMYTREPTNEDALRASIETMLVRKLGSVPPHQSRGETTSWTWGAGGGPVSLYRIHVVPGGQQIDLSVQRGPGVSNYDEPRSGAGE